MYKVIIDDVLIGMFLPRKQQNPMKQSGENILQELKS